MAVYLGKAWRFGDHVDTDAIIPANYLTLSDPAELAAHCFEIAHPQFCRQAAPGDIMVGGVNFGCGSSREHAPVAIKAMGIPCVIADSFARIFYRNSYNIGLPLLESPAAAEAVTEGQELAVDLAQGSIENLTSGEIYSFEPIPANMQAILKEGGLMEFLGKHGSLSL